MGSFDAQELAARAKVNPWALRDKFTAGNPAEITALAKNFADASGDAELAGALAKEGSELAAQGYHLDQTPVHDPEKHVADTKKRLGDNGEKMARIARILDAISDDLETRTTGAKGEVQALEEEIRGIQTAWNTFWQKNHNQILTTEEYQSCLDGYVTKAVTQVQTRGNTVKTSVEAYEQAIAGHLKSMADLGYLPPGEVDKGPNTLDEILARYQVAPDAKGTVSYPPWPKSMIVDAREITKTEAEMLDKLGLLGQKDFSDLRDDAFGTSEKFYSGQDMNDSHRDAFRHAYWNALMVDKYGAAWAEKYATTHEALPGNPADREAMDLYNNEVGRKIAIANPDAGSEELAKLVREAVSGGKMVVIDKGGELRYSDQVGGGQTGKADDPAQEKDKKGAESESGGSGSGTGNQSGGYETGSGADGSW